MLLLALMFFVALDATGKHLSTYLPVPMLVWARYTVHFLLMLVLLAPSMRKRLVTSAHPKLLTLRALCLLAVTIFAMLAFRIMPIAETTAILFTAPLIVTLAAGPLLGERIGALRWLAVLTGFGGVLLVARPGGTLPADGVAYAAVAAVAFAAYQLLTRRLSAGEHPVTMLFYTALVGSLATTLTLPWIWSLPPLTALDALLVVSLGVYGGIGHFLLTRAFREAPASTLSPIMYAQLAWATLAGALAFGEWPDGAALAGIVVIAGAGVLIALDTRRDARLSRQRPPS